MKKLIALLLVFVMVLGMAACSVEKKPAETKAPEAPVVDETKAPEAQQPETPATTDYSFRHSHL